MIDTVEEVLKVGRRMAAVRRSGFAFSFLPSSKASFVFSSAALGGRARNGSGERPLSGVGTKLGVFIQDDSEDAASCARERRCSRAAISAASDRETADGFLRRVLKVKRVRGVKLARVSSNFSRRALIALSQVAG